jgi:hypothetical protein
LGSLPALLHVVFQLVHKPGAAAQAQAIPCVLVSFPSASQTAFSLEEVRKLESLLYCLLAANLLRESRGSEPRLQQVVFLLRDNPGDLLLHEPLHAGVLLH